MTTGSTYAVDRPNGKVPNHLKIALNAYSFNQPLSAGNMDIDDMLEFCAQNGFYACDITAYYFPGYPEVPGDEYLSFELFDKDGSAKIIICLKSSFVSLFITLL